MKHFRMSVVSTMGIALVLFAVGCTKKRDPKAPDALARNLFEISEFKGTQYNLKTESQMMALSWAESSKVGNEKGRVKVKPEASDVPERLQFMVSDLDVVGQANQNIKLHFEIDSENVTAYKIVQNLEDLSSIERQSVETGKDRTEYKVPMFQFKVKGYGVLSRVKNELGEETSTLELKDTNWKEATHVQISTTADERVLLGIPESNVDEKETTFLVSKLDNKIVMASQLRDEFNVKIGTIDPQSKVLTRLDSNGMKVYEITTKEKLTEKERNILESKRKQGFSGVVEECSAEVKKIVEKDNVKDCVVVARLNVPTRYVKSEMVKSDKSKSVAVKLTEVPYSSNSGLVQIQKNTEPQLLLTAGSNIVDLRNAVKIGELKDKEFYLRRTFEDGSQSVLFAPGMSGDTKLVRFEFEDNRMIVRSTVEQYEGRNTGKIDRSELMSFPVKYFREQRKDSAGADLVIPQVIPAEKENAEFVQIDWASNTIPNINSPLAFYADGSCLISNGTQTVSDMDMRLNEGSLNFTITGSYTLSPDLSCVNIVNVNDYYWSDPKMTTNVKERISFKVNDASKNKAYVNQIPFDAQNALNYGLFTMANLNPSEKGGLLGRDGNEISYPLVFDIRNGKKIVYYVGGLPEDAKRKELLIEATKNSIAYWNKALKIAFKGTQFERNDDFIELRIDDGTQFPKGHLGDLDRNYIWYMDRMIENGPLGVAQFAPNPHSGVLESANVVMYSGNSAMDSENLIRQAKAMAEYDKMIEGFKQAALAELKKEEAAEAQGNDNAINGQIAPQNIGVGPETKHKIAKTVQAVTRSRNGFVNRKMSKAIPKVNKISSSALNSISTELSRLSKNKSETHAGKELAINNIYSNIMKRVITLKSQDEEQIESVIIDEMLKSSKLPISAEQRKILQSRNSIKSYQSNFLSRINNRPGCVKYSGEMMPRKELIAKYANTSFEDILKSEVTSTLTHEIGHTLGLTHNFKGSYDKKNFSISEDAEKNRNYSSIMDYMAGYEQDGADPGPYDIHAIRAGYAGLVEIDPSVQSKLTKNSQGQTVLALQKTDKSKLEIPVVDGRFVSVMDVKKAVGAESSWLLFNKNKVKSLPLKNYQYCTDKHVYEDPTCERYDVGTSAEEIAQNVISEYKSLYMLTNHAGNRINYNWYNKVGLYSRHISNFLRIRQFMDELFYKLITRDINSQEELMSHFMASVKTMQFFNEIIRTPTEALSATDKNRFKAIAYEFPIVDEKGQPTGKAGKDVEIVEIKSLEDIAETAHRIDTLGIEIDKVIATQLLTLRGFPLYKYNANNIDFSYLDFEKFLLEVKSAQDSPVANLLLEMNTNKVTPMVFTSRGTAEPLTSGFKADLNSWLRLQAGISSIIDLEALSIFSEYNYANLFKVGSSVGRVPKGKSSVIKLGIDPKSSTRVEYFALDNAVVSEEMIRQAKVLDYFMKADAGMVKVTAGLIATQLNLIAELNKIEIPYEQLDKAIAKNPGIKDIVAKSDAELVHLVNYLNELNKTKLILPDEALKQGVTMEVLAGVVRDYITDQLATAVDLAELMKGDKKPAGIDQLIEMIRDANAQQAEGNDLMALTQRVLIVATANNQALNEAMKLIVNGSESKVSYSILLANLELLNKLTLMTNPEYNR